MAHSTIFQKSVTVFCYALLLFLTSCGSLYGPTSNEVNTFYSYSPEVRILLNSPAEVDPAKPSLLILYALPNGNTIEMTAGKIIKEGDDWHYNIQHIAAQTRFLRTVVKDQNIHTAYLENIQRSWPAWRKKYEYKDSLVAAILDYTRNKVGDTTTIILAGHSGGGSFLNGFLNAYDSLPRYITRIAYLDANYSYEDSLNHGGKLLQWLREDSTHQLIVFAYDDREIKLNGRKIINETGGTFRATQRMVKRFSQDTEITFKQDSTIQQFSALQRRAQFIVHTNPDSLILHTVLVEKNGLIHTVLFNTPYEERSYRFFGERIYNDLIREE
ncbi:MAG: hypothetical protein KA247_03890 [Bacteroidetes bacterium]|nr:hypothetical protein [Bacteroidota bacterium]